MIPDWLTRLSSAVLLSRSLVTVSLATSGSDEEGLRCTVQGVKRHAGGFG